MNAELAARRIAAAAVLADFQREAAELPFRGPSGQDWQVWALRLAQHLQHMLEVTAPPAGPGRHAATGGGHD